MGWLLELLFEGIKEMCSQFIIDMMDVASSMFTEILSCDLNLFEELFGVAGDLYRNGIVPIAIMLLLMILVWQLFKGMFSKITASSEEPLELIFRSAISLFMIAYSKDIVNYILDIVGTPYQWVTGTAVAVNSFSGYVTAAEAVVSMLGIDVISIQMLLLIMHFVVAWNYFKMLFILAERYVLLGIFSYTAPLAFAAGGSKSTNNITTAWVRMFGGQVLIIILDAWCLKMFLSGYGNLMSSSYGFTKFFAATMCLIGFCKITAKLDSYMASLGVNLGRIGGGLSGMGALLMAGRLLHMGGSGGRTGGGTPDKGASPMGFGTGKPIPMGSGSPDFGADGVSGMQNGSNIGGMNGGMNAEENPELGEEFGWHGAENDFDSGMPGTESANAPFGMPDESDFDAQEGSFDGMESGEGMAYPGSNYEEDSAPFGDEDIPMNSSYDEAGEIPGMEYGEDGPFGAAFDEPEAAFGAGIGMEEGNISGSGEAEPGSGIEISGETGGIAGLQDGGQEAEPGSGMEVSGEAGGIAGLQDGGQETEPGAGMADSGILSYDSESAQAKEHAGIMSGGGEAMAADYAGGLDSPGSSVHSGMPGTSAAGAGISDTDTAGNGMTGSGTMRDGQHHSMGTGGSVSDGGISGAVSGAESMQGEKGVSQGGMQSGTAMETGAGTYGQPGQGRPDENFGSYLAERDGERYMRYDASQFEKPQGAYQTIHEDGKTYYELPEKEQAPAVLPETKAVLEKNGMIRLEKIYKETPQERGVPKQAPKKKPENKKNAAKRYTGGKREKR